MGNNPTSHTNNLYNHTHNTYMRALLPLLLLLACSSAFEIDPSLFLSTTPSTEVAVPPNADTYIWLIQRNIMKGAPYLGLYANKTIYAFPDFTTIPGISLASAQPTQLYFEIFDLLPLVRGKIDSDAFLAKVPP